ncbi:hypothetical protein [Candidatus Tisiphia endosymbiont of Beris chalybata]|uniref:hypothetical protein n=1 Tax=Candidatus Tisiphia endosymbiont of Beris chalybata TaxID=3066262 RepID=UPI00312CAB43
MKDNELKDAEFGDKIQLSGEEVQFVTDFMSFINSIIEEMLKYKFPLQYFKQLTAVTFIIDALNGNNSDGVDKATGLEDIMEEVEQINYAKLQMEKLNTTRKNEDPAKHVDFALLPKLYGHCANLLEKEIVNDLST